MLRLEGVTPFFKVYTPCHIGAVRGKVHFPKNEYFQYVLLKSLSRFSSLSIYDLKGDKKSTDHETLSEPPPLYRQKDRHPHDVRASIPARAPRLQADPSTGGSLRQTFRRGHVVLRE